MSRFLYILMCSELSTSVRRQAGQVPYVEWLGSEAGWWHGWCHLPFPPTLRVTVGTPSRAAFFTPKQSHENERTRYLYITRNPRFFKRLTFPQSQNQFEKFHVNSLPNMEDWKKGQITRGSISIFTKNNFLELNLPRFGKYRFSNATTEFISNVWT